MSQPRREVFTGIQPTSETDGNPSFVRTYGKHIPLGGDVVEDDSSDISDELSNKMRQLSPNTQCELQLVLQQLQNKDAVIGKDGKGRPVIEYKDNTKIWWDASYGNTVASPRSDDDLKAKMEACFEHIEYIKKIKPPSGIVLDRSHVRPHAGDYREKFDFIKTKEVLGSGNLAGDIVVVKDRETGSESAQKTMMISCFRTDEIRCWVDLSGTGISPELYIFKIEGNKVIIHMEKIEKGITLRDVIDNHMSALRKVNPALVKPLSLYVFSDLLSAVQTMHEKGWTHRDLHPGNIMLQKTDCSIKVRVLDFGMAVPLESRDGLSGFRSDLREAIRKFCAMYVHEEFDSKLDLEQNWETKLSERSKLLQMTDSEKEELLCLIDSSLQIVVPSEFYKLKERVDSEYAKLVADEKIDSLMTEAISILFPDKEFNTGSSMDCAANVQSPLEFLLKLRNNISIGRSNGQQ